MKKRRRPYKPRPKSWNSIQIALMSSSTAKQSDNVHRRLATEAYASLEKLTSGIFTLRDFVAVSKLNAFAYMLAIEIFPGLDDESREAVAEQKHAIEQAAEALHSIAERYNRTDKFGATGPELEIIRKAFGLLDALTGYANVGESVRAMQKADQMTQQALRTGNFERT